jgi:hypothetical protein
MSYRVETKPHRNRDKFKGKNRQTGENILDKLTKLQHLYRDGCNNEVVSLTLDKILAYEREITEKEAAKFREKLEHYERQYQMSSEDFYVRFEKGELGDEMDFFESIL